MIVKKSGKDLSSVANRNREEVTCPRCACEFIPEYRDIEIDRNCRYVYCPNKTCRMKINIDEAARTLQERRDNEIVQCSACNVKMRRKELEYGYNVDETRIKHKCCFNCAVWFRRVENPSRNSTIIDDVYYGFKPYDRDRAGIARCRDRTYNECYIYQSRSGVYDHVEIAARGCVPDYFKPLLKFLENNIEIITAEEYYKHEGTYL